MILGKASRGNLFTAALHAYEGKRHVTAIHRFHGLYLWKYNVHARGGMIHARPDQNCFYDFFTPLGN